MCEGFGVVTEPVYRCRRGIRVTRRMRQADVEHLTFNQRVEGSVPTRVTMSRVVSAAVHARISVKRQTTVSRSLKVFVALATVVIVTAGIYRWMSSGPVRAHEEVVSIVEIDGSWFGRYASPGYVHGVRLADGRQIRLKLRHAYRTGDLVRVNFLEDERSHSAWARWDLACARPCLDAGLDSTKPAILRPR